MSALPTAGLEAVRFGADGLVPAVVQHHTSNEVLMVGFMNREALERTLETGDAWFWSRSRGELWHKGATSGNVLRVREVRRNCEDNSLLLLADPAGPTCHTGAQSCYFRHLDGTLVLPSGAGVSPASGRGVDPPPTGVHFSPPLPGAGARAAGGGVGGEGGLDWLFAILERRRTESPDASYTARLLAAGVDRIARKIGEEAAEVIIAAKNAERARTGGGAPDTGAAELAAETADLWYHSLVLLLDAGLTPEDVYNVLRERHRQKSGAPDVAGTPGAPG